jgi:hypothetical protein
MNRAFRILLTNGKTALVEMDAESCVRCGTNSVEFISGGSSGACMIFTTDVDETLVDGRSSVRQEFGLDDRNLAPNDWWVQR